MFIMGIGSTLAFTPPRYWYNGNRIALAAAFALARDTASMAFAPRLPLLSVPSVSIRIRSIRDCFNPFLPTSASLILVLMFATAFLTPSPQYLGSPSLNSIASNCPVLAPEGTAACSQNRSPVSVSVSTTSASTVGFPLESRISLPWIFVICKYRFISKPRFPFYLPLFPIQRIVILNWKATHERSYNHESDPEFF